VLHGALAEADHGGGCGCVPVREGLRGPTVGSLWEVRKVVALSASAMGARGGSSTKGQCLPAMEAAALVGLGARTRKLGPTFYRHGRRVWGTLTMKGGPVGSGARRVAQAGGHGHCRGEQGIVRGCVAVARGAREGGFVEKNRGAGWDGQRHGQVASQVAGAAVWPGRRQGAWETEEGDEDKGIFVNRQSSRGSTVN
jgi:hypothetical protein